MLYNDVLFPCVMAFPKQSRLVACMRDMSTRDFEVDRPFVSLLVRLFECSLLFRHVNNNNVTNKSCPLCPASREQNGCDSVTFSCFSLYSLC